MAEGTGRGWLHRRKRQRLNKRFKKWNEKRWRVKRSRPDRGRARSRHPSSSKQAKQLSPASQDQARHRATATDSRIVMRTRKPSA